MRGLTGYNFTQSGYDFDIPDHECVLPLDPIPKEIVAALRLPTLMTCMASEMPSWAKVLEGIFAGQVGFVGRPQTPLPVVAKKFAR